jgi:lysyl-tRNA synthetase class 2
MKYYLLSRQFLLKTTTKSKKRIVLAGRIMAQRGHGGANFLDINDGSAKIQVIVKQDKVGEKGYQFFLDVFE